MKGHARRVDIERGKLAVDVRRLRFVRQAWDLLLSRELRSARRRKKEDQTVGPHRNWRVVALCPVRSQVALIQRVGVVGLILQRATRLTTLPYKTRFGPNSR